VRPEILGEKGLPLRDPAREVVRVRLRKGFRY